MHRSALQCGQPMRGVFIIGRLIVEIRKVSLHWDNQPMGPPTFFYLGKNRCKELDACLTDFGS